MLSSVLTSDTAALANIRIMRAFVAMRKQLSELAAQKQQIDRLELSVLSGFRLTPDGVYP